MGILDQEFRKMRGLVTVGSAKGPRRRSGEGAQWGGQGGGGGGASQSKGKVRGHGNPGPTPAQRTAIGNAPNLVAWQELMGGHRRESTGKTKKLASISAAARSKSKRRSKN